MRSSTAAAVLMPGFVNGHTHLYSALAAGMPPPKSPTNFHEFQIHLVAARPGPTLPSVRTSGVTLLAAIRCGTTTLIDHHASPNAIEGSLSVLEEGIATVGCRNRVLWVTCNGPNEPREGLAIGGTSARASNVTMRKFAALVSA
jgi:cytosine/adenosine deaminase-related metal-dependent hydrolase